MKLIAAGILAAILCISCQALENNPEAQLDEELITLRIEGQDSNTNLISLQFEHAPLSEVLEFFKDKSGTTLNYNEEDIKDCSITAELEDVEWQDALRVILDSVDMAYTEQHGHIRIIQRAEYDALPPFEKSYEIVHPDTDKAMQFALRMLKHIQEIDSRPNFSNHCIVVNAHLDGHRAARKAIQAVNNCERIPLFPEVNWPTVIPSKIPAVQLPNSQKGDDGLVVNTFFLKHVEAIKLAERLNVDISLESNETISIFSMANAIVAETTPTNMARIASICAYLDNKRWYIPETSSPGTNEPHRKNNDKTTVSH